MTRAFSWHLRRRAIAGKRMSAEQDTVPLSPIPPAVEASDSLPVIPIDTSAVEFDPAAEFDSTAGEPAVTYTLPSGRVVTMPEFRELSVSDLEPPEVTLTPACTPPVYMRGPDTEDAG